MSDAPAFRSWEQAVDWLRKQPDQQALVSAAYYDDPLMAAATRYWQSEEWSAIRSLLPHHKGAALDIGAGRGIASFALAKEGFRVTALEPDPSAIVGAEAIRGLAREAALPIDVTQEFSERLPFSEGQFDVVFARAVLHHTRDLGVACREMFRVLKPGGRLLAVREHVISRQDDLPAFLAIHPLHRYYGGENAFLLSEYERAIDAAGFVGRRSLAPLESVINFAPQTAASLREEIASRLARGIPGLRTLVYATLSVPGVWSAGRRLLERVDHRPGRLYSFIAQRP
jgi:SAM-dependent methyltransferase